MFSTFGEWLGARRKAVGLDRIVDFQSALAGVGVEVTHSAISQWESGRTTPTRDHQLKIWVVLQVTGGLREEVELALAGVRSFPAVEPDAAPAGL